MFGKTIFSFPRNCQNAFKCVFAKHPLRPKKSFTKGCSNKQSLKYLTQNKTKWVDPKTLVQRWIEPKTNVWPENKPKGFNWYKTKVEN